MSKTYGKIQGNHGMATRTGCKEIWGELSTWNGSVTVTVFSDETAHINVNNLDITLNGTRMFAERTPPPPLNNKEMIKLLTRNLRELFKDHRDTEEKKQKDTKWLHSLLPETRVRELGPLIKFLQMYKTELDTKLDTKKVVEELE